MFGISSSGKERIASRVNDIFDRIALDFIGELPSLKFKKFLIISSKPHLGLANLFVQAMNNRTPSLLEQDALKSLLESSHSYIESLKHKTTANITERIDGLSREANLNDQPVNEDEMQAVYKEEMVKAASQIKMIAETEGTKLRNMGSAMDIAHVSSHLGDKDPSVFFVCVHDNKLCPECKRLHLMPDGITPKIWKLSELSHGYHKRGGDRPSILGLHPNDRCTLTYLSNDFGFDKNGKVSYKKSGHDAYSEQKS